MGINEWERTDEDEDLGGVSGGDNTRKDRKKEKWEKLK